MSVATVLKLEEYRDRRQHRARTTEAYFRLDRDRGALYRHLAEIAAVAGADRVSSVWVDEYGPGLVHPFAVLDLLADRPRRRFDMELLQRAWELGVPGAHDQVAGPGSTGPSTFAIALGSDGARAWFLVADSVTARPPLDAETRDRLMFIAGEVSAIVLHRDLDGQGATASAAGRRFAGWPLLQDLEGREDDEAEGRRIAQRFVVARLLRMLLDDDLAVSPERVAEQVSVARRELAQDGGLEGGEYEKWTRLVDAYAELDAEAMAGLALDLGLASEARGHEHGARELYACAFGLASVAHVPPIAADAARYLGRLHRRRADRDVANGWYEGARDIATLAGLPHIAARSVAGIANTKREAGNLPAARPLLSNALELAEQSGDASTIVSIHHDIVNLEHSAGNVQEALHHAWLAVGVSNDDAPQRTRSLAALGGALEKVEDFELAEDVWSVVAETSGELYYQVFAFDALAHIAAVRGDTETFRRYAERCDALGYESVPSAAVQVLHYRGLSYRALGRLDEAEVWLKRAVAFAEEHRFNETLFKAERDLSTLSDYEVEVVETTPAAPAWIRDGVQSMRRELAGAAG